MDDTVLIHEIRAANNYKLELRREIVESKGFKLIRTKINIWSINLVVESNEVMSSAICNQ